MAELSPGPDHGRHERNVGPDDVPVQHVQRIWRHRPPLDTHASVFHVIDDPIFAVGADGEFGFARPAYNRLRAQVTEAVVPGSRRWGS
jgi:hypothetical protein